MHESSLYVYANVYMYMRVFIGVYAWIKFICICECLYVYMHGSSLYVYESVYRCICMDRVYMYMRVFIGVYAWIKFICICKLFRSVLGIHY